MNKLPVFVLGLAIALGGISCDRRMRAVANSEPSLIQAMRQGRADAVLSDLQEGADPNVQNDGGETAMFYARRVPGIEAASALVAKGGDINHEDKRHITPFMSAVIHGRDDLARWMIENKADVQAVDIDGATALHAAALQNNPAIVRLLISKGADPNAADRKLKRTPLMIAASANAVDAIQALVVNGAAINQRDYRGESAIFYAVGLNKSAALQALITAGADLSVTGNEGPIAGLAGAPGREDCLQLLLRAGMKPQATNPSVKIAEPNPTTQLR